MSENSSPLSRTITWIVIGVLAIIAIKLAIRLLGFLLGMLGMVAGLAMFVLFTVAPILVVGWLAVAAWKAFTKDAPA